MRIGSVVVLVGAVCTGSVRGGSLTPPAGPIESSMKTLDQVEPRIPLTQETAPGDASSTFIISQSGSYYLMGDFVQAEDKRGILVAAPNVTIDLMGFAMTGPPPSGILRSAISSTFLCKQVIVRNGVIEGWTGIGVQLDNGTFPNEDQGTSALVENLVVRDCGREGILCEANSIVRRCIVEGCGLYGIQTTLGNCTIQECVAHDNQNAGILASRDTVIVGCTATNNGAGIYGSDNCVVVDCVAGSNQGSGIRLGIAGVIRGCAAWINTGHGFELNGPCAISDCVSRSNSGSGFAISSSSFEPYGMTFDNCTAVLNGADGFNLEQSARLTSCVARENNDVGFRVGANSILNSCEAWLSGAEGMLLGDDGQVIACAANQNELAGIVIGAGGSALDCTANKNGDDGIRIGGNASVARCQAHENLTDGIHVGSGSSVESCAANANALGIRINNHSRVRDCLTRLNTGVGIRAESYCRITDNHSEQNTGAGIRVAFGCRVEGNSCSENTPGLLIDNARNVVFRNTFILNSASISNPGGSTLPPSSGPGNAVDNDNITH